ncbi:MAG: methyltransferase domain-containing protein, partial [Candidatus Poribacteria bacterium]|nr:methyltransferase domain-containing protein [Candidatus Poribacteria bacterium]
RYGENTGQTCAVLVTTERKPEVMAAYVKHLHDSGLAPTCVVNGVTDSVAGTSEGAALFIDGGEPYFQERLRDKTFTLSPDSFFQPNTEAAELLVGVAERYANLSGSEMLLDLYCGVGVFSILFSSQVSQSVGIEILPAAVIHATQNADQNGVSNARFLAANLDEGIHGFLGSTRPDVVITDPPRAGMHPKAVAALRDLAPSRIVYVSCHPVPQAENIAALCEGGLYDLAEMQPVDLFPQTPHVENVALLRRN